MCNTDSSHSTCDFLQLYDEHQTSALHIEIWTDADPKTPAEDRIVFALHATYIIYIQFRGFERRHIVNLCDTFNDGDFYISKKSNLKMATQPHRINSIYM